MKNAVKHSCFLLLLLLISGCTGLRKIGDEEYLYTGSEIRFDSIDKRIHNQRAVESELFGLIDLKPNTKLFWMRPFLSLHNTIKEPKKETGFWHWLKYSVGEKPALIKDLLPENIDAVMANRLQNRGFFDATVSHTITQKRKTATATFAAITGKPYTLKSISYPDGDKSIQKEIHNMHQESLLKPEAQYHLRVFQDERDRIDELLKNRGYFYFSSDYLLFKADTAVGDRQIDVEINLKPAIQEEAFVPYRINNVYVSDDYSLQDYHPDTLRIGNYFYISNQNLFKPKIILDAVFFEKDSLYSRINHYNTLRYMMGLGVYKFTNARFSKVDTVTGQMDVNLFLTPVNKISLSAEMSLATKTNNFAGPGLNLIVKNRNLFRGAELLTITLGGRFEWQTGGDTKGQVNYEANLDASLEFPRIVPSNIVKKTSKQFVPKSILTLGGGIYDRVDLYRLNSFYASWGYSWRPSESVNHLYLPVDVSFTQLAESSPEFEEYLNENPNIRKSFDEQFIIGSSYTYILSNMHKRNKKGNFYLSESVDLAGNLVSLIFRVANGEKTNPENPNELLDVAYSQFVRLRHDFRYFHKTGKNSQLGWRIITSAAIPYLNSSTVPYIRQFYVGGTNSVRAFRARTVGPGTYQTPEDQSDLYVDQTGDIKLETSLEYRFPIYSYFKGALFADAGNIWLINEDEQRPGGKFDINNFYRELAVGAGIGLRIDFNFFVIRFDLALPLRSPDLPEGEQWLISKTQFGNKSWRQENLILNIAIGYPF